MRLLGILTAAAVTLSLSGPVLAQEDPLEDVIKLRQALMQGNQESAKIAVKMIRGTNEFDPELAAIAMTAIANSFEVVPVLFPEGTETGANTKATPEIWSNRDEFNAIAEKMIADASAAADAAAGGLDAFQAAFGAVGGNCQSCHEQFRTE